MNAFVLSSTTSVMPSFENGLVLVRIEAPP